MHVAVGMTTGHLAIRSRVQKTSEAVEERIRHGTPKWFQRGGHGRIDAESVGEDRAALSKQDKYLKDFKYKEGLEAVLDEPNPKFVIAMLQELLTREVLSTSISSTSLPLLLNFICAHLSTYPILIAVLDIVVEGGWTGLERVRMKVLEEIRVGEGICEVLGIVEGLCGTIY